MSGWLRRVRCVAAPRDLQSHAARRAERAPPSENRHGAECCQTSMGVATADAGSSSQRPNTNVKTDEWLAGIGEDANYEYAIPRPNATSQAPKIRKRDRDRAEALRLAGGPKPSLRQRAVALALEKGTVRTRDLTDIGVPRCYLARMCDEGLLIKVGYGLYQSARREAA